MRRAPADRVSRTQSGSGLSDRFPKAICRLDRIRGRSRSISSLSCVEWRWRLRVARREGICIRSWTRQCAHGPHPGDDRAVDRPARLREYCEARQGGRFHVCQAKCADHFKHLIPFARTHNRCWRSRRSRVRFPAVHPFVGPTLKTATGRGYFWPIWPLLGCGLGLGANYWGAFLRKPISDEEIRRELEKGR
jgi:hypothetical protein